MTILQTFNKLVVSVQKLGGTFLSISPSSKSVLVLTTKKVKAAIELYSKSAVSYAYFAKTKVLDIAQVSKTRAEFLAGKFYTYWEKLLTETLVVSEQTSVVSTKTVQDLSVLTDTVATNNSKPIGEVLSLIDGFEKITQWNKTIVENIVLTDTIFPVKYSTRNPQDFVVVSDDINGVLPDDDQNLQVFKPTTELTSIGDTTIFSTTTSKTEILGVVSAGLLSNQNYGMDYFLEDYVGTSRALT